MHGRVCKLWRVRVGRNRHVILHLLIAEETNVGRIMFFSHKSLLLHAPRRAGSWHRRATGQNIIGCECCCRVKSRIRMADYACSFQQWRNMGMHNFQSHHRAIVWSATKGGCCHPLTKACKQTYFIYEVFWRLHSKINSVLYRVPLDSKYTHIIFVNDSEKIHLFCLLIIRMLIKGNCKNSLLICGEWWQYLQN